MVCMATVTVFGQYAISINSIRKIIFCQRFPDVFYSEWQSFQIGFFKWLCLFPVVTKCSGNNLQAAIHPFQEPGCFICVFITKLCFIMSCIFSHRFMLLPTATSLWLLHCKNSSTIRKKTRAVITGISFRTPLPYSSIKCPKYNEYRVDLFCVARQSRGYN